MIDNAFLLISGRLAEIQPLGTGIKLFKVQLDDPAMAQSFTYQPGSSVSYQPLAWARHLSVLPL